MSDYVITIDPEALIMVCVPGGHYCDPQQVADAIREYLRATPAPEPAAPDRQRPQGPPNRQFTVVGGETQESIRARVEWERA